MKHKLIFAQVQKRTIESGFCIKKCLDKQAFDFIKKYVWIDI